MPYVSFDYYEVHFGIEYNISHTCSLIALNKINIRCIVHSSIYCSISLINWTDVTVIIGKLALYTEFGFDGLYVPPCVHIVYCIITNNYWLIESNQKKSHKWYL